MILKTTHERSEPLSLPYLAWVAGLFVVFGVAVYAATQELNKRDVSIETKRTQVSKAIEQIENTNARAMSPAVEKALRDLNKRTEAAETERDRLNDRLDGISREMTKLDKIDSAIEKVYAAQVREWDDGE